MCNDCSPDSSTDDLSRNSNQDSSQMPDESANRGTPESDSGHSAPDVSPQAFEQSDAEEVPELESNQDPLTESSPNIPEYWVNLSKTLEKGSKAAKRQSDEQSGRDFSYLLHYNLEVRRAMLLTKIAFRKQWSFRLIADEERVTFIVAALRHPSLAVREYWTEKVADLMLQGDALFFYFDSDRMISLASMKRQRLWALVVLAVLSALFMTGILAPEDFEKLRIAFETAFGL